MMILHTLFDSFVTEGGGGGRIKMVKNSMISAVVINLDLGERCNKVSSRLPSVHKNS